MVDVKENNNVSEHEEHKDVKPKKEHKVRKVKKSVKGKKTTKKTAKRLKKSPTAVSAKPHAKVAKKVKKKKPVWQWILAIIIVIAAVGLIYYAKFYGNVSNVSKQQNADLQQNVQQSEVLVTVGDEMITKNDLENYRKTLPLQTRNMVDDATLLKLLINQKLFLLDAKEKNIELSDEEFQQELSLFLQQQNMTLETFKNYLESLGIDSDLFIKYLKTVFLLQKFMNEFFLPQIQVSEEEIRNFYNQNRFYFGNASYEDVKMQINATLVNVQLQALTQQYLTDLWNKYRIEIKAPYDLQICLLDNRMTDKLYLFSTSNCPPCEEMKKALEQLNATYYEFDMNSEIFKCFNKTLKSVGFAMPTLICKDGSFTLDKTPEKLQNFIESCS